MSREADSDTRRVWFMSRGRPWKEIEVPDPPPPQMMVASERAGDGDRVLACFPADNITPVGREVFYQRRFDRVLLYDGCVEPTVIFVEWCG